MHTMFLPPIFSPCLPTECTPTKYFIYWPGWRDVKHQHELNVDSQDWDQKLDSQFHKHTKCYITEAF